MAKDGSSLIKPHMPFYENARLATAGMWRPQGTFGQDYEFNKRFFDELAKNYDPLGIYCATVDCGHIYWQGDKALGIVPRISSEMDKGEPVLVGDVANVEWKLSGEIEDGHWPYVSIEWNDAELYARMTESTVERFLFYGQKLYLRKLAMVGQVPPGCAGIAGAFPKRIIPEDAIENAEADERPYILPLAASMADLPVLRLYNPHAINPAEAAPSAAINSPKEAPVDDEDDTEPNKKTVTPTAATVAAAADNSPEAVQARLAAAEAENEQLKANQAAQAAQGAQSTDPGVLRRLEALETENAQLRATQRGNAISTMVDQQLAAGMPTAAAEIYRELANELYGTVGARLSASQETTFAEGKQPLELLHKLLAAIPKAPQSTYGMPHQERPQAASNQGTLQASQDDAEVARQLGMKPEEVAASRSGVVFTTEAGGKD